MTQIPSLALPRTLTADRVAELRREFPYQQDEDWVSDVAAASGWPEANRRFLRWHHDRGEAEMRALMDTLAVRGVGRSDVAGSLLRLAYAIFMPHDHFRGNIEALDDDRVRVVVRQCPMFEKLMDADGHGPTACGSWHHRRGWFDAMGIEADDSVYAEQTWGEPACVTEITFRL